MTWKNRLAQLVLAGGSLTLTGCLTGFACNANPDPCCPAPNGDACKVATACRRAGGYYDGYRCSLDDLSVPVAHDLAVAARDFSSVTDGDVSDGGSTD